VGSGIIFVVFVIVIPQAMPVITMMVILMRVMVSLQMMMTVSWVTAA
jgi:hypothetical protein